MNKTVRPYRHCSTIAIKAIAIALCILLFIAGLAQGLVGGAQWATDGIARSVVGLVGPSPSFCTATAIARNLILTAGHCVQSGTDYKVQYKDINGSRKFAAIVDWERPPQFVVPETGPPTADIALVRLANSLPDDVGVATLDLQRHPVWPGDRFIVIGGGIGLKGLHETGNNRVATLVATGPFTNLQIILIDSSGNQIGVCSGDSGSPVFQSQTDGAKVIGVVSWAGARNKKKWAGARNNKTGCGELTGVTPLAPYHRWIEETVRKLSGIPHNEPGPK